MKEKLFILFTSYSDGGKCNRKTYRKLRVQPNVLRKPLHIVNPIFPFYIKMCQKELDQQFFTDPSNNSIQMNDCDKF